MYESGFSIGQVSQVWGARSEGEPALTRVQARTSYVIVDHRPRKGTTVACKHQFTALTVKNGKNIVGFRCSLCGDVFDPLPAVSNDGEHTHWFALARNPAVKAIMSSGDVATNLLAYANADPPPPLHNGVFYVGVDL